MKSSTDELLDLSFDMDAEPPRSGFTGGLDLYSELIDFSEPPSAKPAADSGPLPQTGDVIRITGALAGFGKAAMAAMMVCEDCGNQTPGGEMFCIHCGGLIDEQEATAEVPPLTLAGLCDDCGGVVESDEIFCPSCGSVMATS